MTTEIPTQYSPKDVERSIYRRWTEGGAFRAVPDERDDRYVIMMPLPNVTGALHMGHAMDNVMQDMLIRWHRMQGHNTLWQPGTDHAGIGTQAVVEKRLFELEGKTRHDVGREGLVKRIWDWKDQYQARIVSQQQAMGCSCDWDRQRFTMDKVCTRAVREAFFRLFRDGLIFRGLRLVNWDCHLGTAVADDEVERKTTQGGFWHLRYPIIDPRPGEPEHVSVATTRPETMLGDTAVAAHPDPRGQLARVIAKLKDRLAKASAKEKPDLEKELERVEARVASHLPRLEALAAMARDGRRVRLPLMERDIPLILDEWAKPELGSGCVKITPAHDPNDYDVWTRHKDEIGIINILNGDGTLNAQAGPYQGLDRAVARKKVVADLDAQGRLESHEEREVELGISDRSKTPIEPYLSRQWFVRMADVEGGVVMGRGTGKEHASPGLAQAAIDAVVGDWRSPTGLKLSFYPEQRYGTTYVNWLAEKRDWCIGRQLWWGHRIPIWSKTVEPNELESALARLPATIDEELYCWVSDRNGDPIPREAAAALAAREPDRGPFEIQYCPRDEDVQGRFAPALEAHGLAQADDVLDTWFSSALWPFSTLGWPDAASAPVGAGQPSLVEGGNSEAYYYPGSCLVTGRDIITLWVARMTILGLYCKGDLPFTDCFIHANILDGKGERMSKSKGNGIDPVDIIERYGADAMRYVLCDMQTGTQDIRLPVQAISPYTGEPVDLATAKHGRTIFTYLCPKTKKEFDVLGTIPDLPQADLISDRFEVGRNFCNKLWNATRFALLNLEGQGFSPLERERLATEDRWILSRLACAIDGVHRGLAAYNPSAAISTARDFFWNEFCDWYLELVKPRMEDASSRAAGGQVLAFVLDQSLRLFHPFIPFITESLFEKLKAIAPERGIETPVETSALLARSSWPRARAGDVDKPLEEEFELLQGTTRAIRDLRARYGVPPRQTVDVLIRAAGKSREVLDRVAAHLANLARVGDLAIGEGQETPKLAATGVFGDVEVYVLGLVDPEKERTRLEKQRASLLGQVDGIEKKLGNEKFLERAPADVVENERRRLDEFKGEVARIDEALRGLGGG